MMAILRWSGTCTIVVLTMISPVEAQVSGMCTIDSDNRFVPHFDIRPSLEVNSAGVLDATRAQLGLTGEPSERAFSFRRTIAAILDSVPPQVSSGPSDAAAQEAFVKTLIDSFQVPTEQALNPQAGILM